MSEDVLAAVVARWPGRWRHPRLAAALAEDPRTTDTRRAELLVTDLADPADWTVALTDLMQRGRFLAADDLIQALAPREAGAEADSGRLPALAELRCTEEQYAAAEVRLVRARAAARAQVAAELDLVNQRARRMGLADAADGETALGFAELDLREAMTLVAKARERIEDAEKKHVARLLGRLDRRLAALAKPDEAGVAEWDSAVRGCVAALEFETAEALLETGPGQLPEAGPATVARASEWRWRNRRIDVVLDWFDPASTTAPGPEFARARPADSDDSARLLLHALRELIVQPGAAPAGRFAAALCGLLHQDAAPQVREDGDGLRTRIFGLGDPRLPRLPLVRAGSVDLWIGDENSPAPDPAPGALLVHFVPAVGAPNDPRPSVAVLHAADLFPLIAAEPGGRPGRPAARRVNLLRTLLPRFDLSVALGGPGVELGAGAAEADSTAWLFDLLGWHIDRSVVDVLLFETGGHPLAVRLAAETLIGHAGSRASRRIEHADLEVLRDGPFRERMVKAALEPLAEDPLTGVVLATLLERFAGPDPISMRELGEEIRRLGPADSLPSEAIDDTRIRAATQRLSTTRLIEPTQEGGLRVRRSGAAAVLRDYVGSAADLFAAYERDFFDGPQASPERTGRILTGLDHSRANDVIVLRSLHDRLREARTPAEREQIDAAITELLEAMQSTTIRSQFANALVGTEQLDLYELLHAVVTAADLTAAAGTRILLRGRASAVVEANRELLGDAVRNLVRNAQQAIGSAAEGGTVLVTLAVHDGPARRQSLVIPAPCASIDIEDNGPGFPPGLAQRLNVGGVLPPPTAAGGNSGRGFAIARGWIEELGGVLEILNRSVSLGGAHVRAWLPIVES